MRARQAPQVDRQHGRRKNIAQLAASAPPELGVIYGERDPDGARLLTLRLADNALTRHRRDDRRSLYCGANGHLAGVHLTRTPR